MIVSHKERNATLLLFVPATATQSKGDNAIPPTATPTNKKRRSGFTITVVMNMIETNTA